MALRIDIDNSSIQELRRELMNLKTDIANATDPDDMLRLAEAAGQVQDKLTDVNEQVAVFAAGSPFERAGKQLGEVRGALANLDFEKAAARAKSLATTVQGISFSTATKGLKDLGTTFAQVGKSLLTNPLFLMAAVIAAISIAIIKVLKDMGIFESMMNTLKGVMEFALFPIKLLIEGLEQLAKWFGLASDASNDFNKISFDNAQKESENAQNRTNAIIAQLERRIKRIKAAGGNELKIAKDVRDVERQIFDEKVKLAKEEQDRLDENIGRLEQRRRIGQEIDEEDLEKLRQRSREINQELTGRLYDLETFDLETVKLNRQSANKIAEQNENNRKQEEARIRAYNERRLKALETFENELLNLRRKLQDLETQSIEDETERRIRQSEIQQQREIENLDLQVKLKLDALREAGVSEEMIEEKERELTAETQLIKTQLIKQGEAERAALRQVEINNISAQLDQIRFSQLSQQEQEETNLQNNLKKTLDSLKAGLDNELLKEEEYNTLKLEEEKKFQEALKAIRDKYTEDSVKKVAKTEEEKRQEAIKTFQKGVDLAQQGFNSLSSFADALLTIEENNAGDSVEAQEAAAKKRFELNKAFAIGQAIINTAMSVSAALAGPPAFPFSIPFAAAAGVAGAAQIAAISSTKFQGGGRSSTSTPSVPSSASPNFQLFGSQQPTTPQTNTEIPQQIQQSDMIVKAYVSESDITDTQNKINKIQKLSEL
jgi:hypothetical protein